MLSVKQISKRYGDSPVQLLHQVDLDVQAGQSVAIMGASGSGKSTFLNIVAGLLSCDSGAVEVDGQNLSQLSPPDRDAFRARNIGMVFQQFNLIDCLSVQDNITLPARYLKLDYEKQLVSLVEALGLQEKQQAPIHELSGGEQQRVAIARALIHSPKLILADEPTGNLDEATSARVADCLFDLAAANQAALVVVTHAREIAKRASRRMLVSGGRFQALAEQ